MKTQSLNGIWNYRIGKGKSTEKKVPFSKLPVGHSECLREFKPEISAPKTFLKFDGITYWAKVFLNGSFLGEMLPYSEYKFDISNLIKADNNTLLVELEDISPAFGPTEGWENFGGIIRDVNLIFCEEDYIEDVFFHTKLLNNYKDAKVSVEVETHLQSHPFRVELYYDGCCKYGKTYPAEMKKIEFICENVNLWSPENPELYELKISMLDGEKEIDGYCCKVGFREFKCAKHRFLLNGKPLFLKGVCKHEMFGDSGHCPTEEQMLTDMKMIKDAGCNFVRLVHYPHNKKILDIADSLGIMVSEEPGLWWSDTSNEEVSKGSLEVLRRTILRDRNHPCIVFWLCFNECIFTEKYLIDSANLCRECDPTRPVSGANCMSDSDTLKYYNICGFDFYTMHPYSQTFERSEISAKILNDKPLVFTEWGGHFVYDNPKLLSEFMAEMYKLYLADSDDGALAGAFFWEWSELNDFNRGRPACIDGNLSEGLVDKYRNPTLIFGTFCDSLKKMGEAWEDPFWFEQTKEIKNAISFQINGNNALKEMINTVNESEKNSAKMRKRKLEKGPVLEKIKGLSNYPAVIRNSDILSFNCNIETEGITLYGMTSFPKGYPLSGEYGEDVAEVIINLGNGESENFTLKNGVDISTVFTLNGSSRINPVTENSPLFANFGYDTNFEQYIINKRYLRLSKKSKIQNIAIQSKNNGYALLIYGISYE